MKIIQIIPGAGNTFYCENCLRDNSLARMLYKMGHEAVIVPLYLPILTDEATIKSSNPVFFGGINVYLQQKLSLFRKTPRWIDRIFDSPILLKLAASRAGMTRASDLGDMTLSMLKGEDGNQAKELERLVSWLKSIEKPDVIHLSNALLLGMAKRIKEELNVPLICTLQDEDIWVDAIPEPQNSLIWKTIAHCATYVDRFIAVSNYYRDAICERIDINCEKVHVVYNGINPDGYEQAELSFNPPVIGFLERQCKEKGLGVLAEAFIIIKKNGRIPEAKLRIAGGKTADDERYVRQIRKRLVKAGVIDDVEFLPNLTREEKLKFLRSLSVLSVPAEHKEAFGVYVIEALASGVPVVQPGYGAFPEVLDLVCGGITYMPNDPEHLARALEQVLLSPEYARDLGKSGRTIALKNFTVEQMAKGVIKVLESICLAENQI